MTVRMPDAEQKEKELLEFCRTANKGQYALILTAAQIANDNISISIPVNPTSGTGYDRLPLLYEIPMQRKDFQGYRRKAPAALRDLNFISGITSGTQK